MAVIDSVSSCGPQAKAQPPPPMAHAPIPIGEIIIPLLPSCLVCISFTIAEVALLPENARCRDRLWTKRLGCRHRAGPRRPRGDLARGGRANRRRRALGRADAPRFCARRLLGRAPHGDRLAVL